MIRLRPSITIYLLGLALLLAGCAAPPDTPVYLVITATPPGIPTAPDLTATPLPTDLPAPASEATPTGTPDVTLIPPTTIGLPTQAPTSAPASNPTPRPPNRLTDNGFEGPARQVEFDAVNVIEGWDPFYCAQPYTDTHCGATRQEAGNEDTLRYSIPEYDATDTAGRVRSGSQAQQWFCEFRVCQGGVYRTFSTTPGEVCEVGAWVQSWSAAEDGDPWHSDLKTEDDRDNSTWYIRIDPQGGSYAWADGVLVSRGFGYDDGVYDQYARISHTFTATSVRATVFIENVRLWPLKNNYSFVDDAFVYCSMPPQEAAVTYPSSTQFRVGSFTPVSASAGFRPNPVGGAWDGRSIRSDDVLRVGDEFWLYYTGRGASPSIGLAKSSDGQTWARSGDWPVLEGGTGWDFRGVEQPTVLHDPATGLFEMWYLSQSEPGNKFSYGVGYATSTDGVNWQRAVTEPVLTHGTPGAWDEERIDGLEAVKVDGTYYLYYSATSLQPDFKRQIGCHTSPNGVDWTPCPGNPLLSPRPDLAPFEGPEVEQPSIIEHDGLWVMAYTGFGGLQGDTFRIGLAASFDGLHWERLRLTPVLEPVRNTDSTDAPALYFDAEQNVLWLWYTEWEDGGGIIGAMAPVTLP